MDEHERLLKIVHRLPEDYKDFGQVERWEDEKQEYPDCSMGCKFARWLEGELGTDWCVCTNPKSHRSGLLTFEHQGCQKFEGGALPEYRGFLTRIRREKLHPTHILYHLKRIQKFEIDDNYIRVYFPDSPPDGKGESIDEYEPDSFMRGFLELVHSYSSNITSEQFIEFIQTIDQIFVDEEVSLSYVGSSEKYSAIEYKPGTFTRSFYKFLEKHTKVSEFT